ncbi:MAG: SUMF1/EgtB/PvdO family nonheme iron enzyme [Polyangiaceae bacterium]|nr:SUMF1/EgtB/PvdO family nonheme iron enzyme [Polyangiaceae bacterium]
MAKLHGGEFVIGRDDGDAAVGPAHVVTLAPFELDVTEATVADYAACVAAGACSEPGAGDSCTWARRDAERLPVNCVDWHQATRFCSWAGKRLPTEAEWERAARAGTGRRYPWDGDSPPADLCWSRDAALGPCPVDAGGGVHSPYGVADLEDNLAEWTSSPFCRYLEEECLETGPVIRGGDWTSSDLQVFGASDRAWDKSSGRLPTVGFRCAR